MKYQMRAGVLYQDERMLARLKGSLNSSVRNVFLTDGTPVLRTDIESADPPDRKSGDVRLSRYVMTSVSGDECASASPDYAEGEDPQIVGWQVHRLPRVDHARFFYGGSEYTLKMQNSQNYSLTDASGRTLVQIFHRGLAGGWNIESDDLFPPQIICGIFAFCRYMEHENEFLIV